MSIRDEKVMLVQSALQEMEDESPETITKCGLCNRTLFDRLMRIQVSTGASQRMVCNEFANLYNADKREEEKIESNAFESRLKRITKANVIEIAEEHPEKVVRIEPELKLVGAESEEVEMVRIEPTSDQEIVGEKNTDELIELSKLKTALIKAKERIEELEWINQKLEMGMSDMPEYEAKDFTGRVWKASQLDQLLGEYEYTYKSRSDKEEELIRLKREIADLRGETYIPSHAGDF